MGSRYSSAPSPGDSSVEEVVQERSDPRLLGGRCHVLGRPRSRARRLRALSQPDAVAHCQDVTLGIVYVGQVAELLIERRPVDGLRPAAVVARVVGRRDHQVVAVDAPRAGHRRRSEVAHRGDRVGHDDLDGVIGRGLNGHRLRAPVGIARRDPDAQEWASGISRLRRRWVDDRRCGRIGSAGDPDHRASVVCAGDDELRIPRDSRCRPGAGVVRRTLRIGDLEAVVTGQARP